MWRKITNVLVSRICFVKLTDVFVLSEIILMGVLVKTGYALSSFKSVKKCMSVRNWLCTWITVWIILHVWACYVLVWLVRVLTCVCKKLHARAHRSVCAPCTTRNSFPFFVCNCPMSRVSQLVHVAVYVRSCTFAFTKSTLSLSSHSLKLLLSLSLLYRQNPNQANVLTAIAKRWEAERGLRYKKQN